MAASINTSELELITGPAAGNVAAIAVKENASTASDGIVTDLLNQALVLLDIDRSAARRRIEHARALSTNQPRADREWGNCLAEWQVKRVQSYVQSNLNRKLRMSEVADQIRLSKSYFSRMFKTTTGISFSEFLIKARIERAKELLLSTDTSICEIALQCGLSDQAHLTRLFKRSASLPPARWRRRVLNRISAHRPVCMSAHAGMQHPARLSDLALTERCVLSEFGLKSFEQIEMTLPVEEARKNAPHCSCASRFRSLDDTVI